MRWMAIKTIFYKELIETLRDRRTILIMLVLPIVLYPMLLIVFGQLVSHQVAKIKQETGVVLVSGDFPDSLIEALEKDELLEVKRVEAPASEIHSIEIDPADGQEQTQDELVYPEDLKKWGRELLHDKSGELLLVPAANSSTFLEEGGTAKILMFWDPTQSDIVAQIEDRVFNIFIQERNRIQQERIQAREDLPDGYFRPIFLSSENVASANKKGGYLAGKIIPMMMVIMVMLGAFYPAVDLTAGEKERGTLQTLLTAPVMPEEIIAGKFLTVFIISIVTAAANLGSMALAITYLLQSGNMGEAMNFSISIGNFIMLFAQLIPVALIFSALMLTVSIFARSFKEAQNYLTPLYLVAIVPIIISSLPGVTLNTSYAAMPILNVTLLMKEVLVKVPSAQLIAIVFISNLAYAMLSLRLAVKIFKSEQVLLSGKFGFSEAWSELTNGKRMPSASTAICYAALTLIAFLYIGGLLQKPEYLVPGLIASQFLILGLPPILFAKWQKYDFKEVFSLRMPTALQTVGVLIMGSLSFVVVNLVAKVQDLFLETPKAFTEQMEKAIGLGTGDYSLLIMVFAFAVTPAICEEILFRGLILNGLRNSLSKWNAIIVTAVMFGIFHISIYRIFPTAIIGLIVTIILVRSGSLYLAILYHLLHNGLTVVAAELNERGKLPFDANEISPLWIAGAAIAYCIGFIIFYIPRKNLNKAD